MFLPFRALERVDRGGVFLLPVVALVRAALPFVGAAFLCGLVLAFFLMGGALLESLSVLVEGLPVGALAFFGLTCFLGLTSFFLGGAFWAAVKATLVSLSLLS